MVVISKGCPVFHDIFVKSVQQSEVSHFFPYVLVVDGSINLLNALFWMVLHLYVLEKITWVYLWTLLLSKKLIKMW